MNNKVSQNQTATEMSVTAFSYKCLMSAVSLLIYRLTIGDLRIIASFVAIEQNAPSIIE